MTTIRFEDIAAGVPLNGEHKRPAGRGKSAQRFMSAVFSNFLEEEIGTPSGKETVRVGLPVRTIGDDLLRITGGWPKRVGQMLFVQGKDHKPLWLLSTESLFAWVNSVLPLQSLANPVVWAGGQNMGSQAQFFAFMQQTVEDYDAVEPLPHHPPLPRHFYMHPPLQGGDGKALRGLLGCFHGATPLDADLIHALFLTGFWGGRPSQRPGALVDAPEDDLP